MGCEGVDWSHMPQVKYQWWTLENTMIKVISIKGGKYLE
jgi:hypothetical protein